MFPLEFAIIEGENIDSWGWFLAYIRNKVTQRIRLCVIADRHPSIVAVMTNVHLSWTKPNAYHRICLCHLVSNFMNRFKDKTLKNFMRKATLVTKVGKFNKHIDTIGIINLEVQPF